MYTHMHTYIYFSFFLLDVYGDWIYNFLLGLQRGGKVLVNFWKLSKNSWKNPKNTGKFTKFLLYIYIACINFQ